MATRWQLFAITLCVILAAPFVLHADILSWDTWDVIPGTEGIEPGPGVQLDHRQLAYAELGSRSLGDQLDLTGANFEASNLTSADLRQSKLTNANLAGANLANANPVMADLTNANLTGANLTSANFWWSTLEGANFSGANLRNTCLLTHMGETAIFDSSTVYNQWTVFPDYFDPVTVGLTFMPSPEGDFDANDVVDAADVDSLAARIPGIVGMPPELYMALRFDLKRDGRLNEEDHHIWVKDLKHTWFGDANLNGEFNSSDFVQVFVGGKYEQGWRDEETGWIHGAEAGWAEGDWNGDRVFDSADFVIAFADGGYEQGPRTDVAAVPEPGGVVLMLLGLVGVLRRRWTA